MGQPSQLTVPLTALALVLRAGPWQPDACHLLPGDRRLPRGTHMDSVSFPSLSQRPRSPGAAGGWSGRQLCRLPCGRGAEDAGLHREDRAGARGHPGDVRPLPGPRAGSRGSSPGAWSHHRATRGPLPLGEPGRLLPAQRQPPSGVRLPSCGCSGSGSTEQDVRAPKFSTGDKRLPDAEMTITEPPSPREPRGARTPGNRLGWASSYLASGDEGACFLCVSSVASVSSSTE